MPVGFRSGRLDDPARTNWNGDGPRPLAWSAWYPAPDHTAEREHFLGPETAPWFTIGPSAPDAPLRPATTQYPVVMLSHGTGGRALHLGWLGRRLAEHGFIAVGIDHHGNTLSEPYRAEGFLCWWERARDLTVLLDQITSHGVFARAIDVNRIHVAGYSLGGCTAAALAGAITEASRFERSATSRDYARGVPEFPDLADRLPGLMECSPVFRASWNRMSDSYRDPRFKAALMLEPGRGLLGFSEDSLTAIEVPSHIIVGSASAVKPAAVWLHERLHSNTLDLLSPEVGHYAFLPEATDAGRSAHPATCVDAPGVDRRSVHDHAAAAAVELFR